MLMPMIGKITLFPYDFAPAGWMYCDGRSLPISENESLFQLLGFNFGGDGADSFALPDLRSLAPANCHYCICVQGQYHVTMYDGLVGETFLLPFENSARDLVECKGQSVPKNTYQLFSLLVGTRFGGDGANFRLPDLGSKTPKGHHSVIAVQGFDPHSGPGTRDLYVGELLLLPYDNLETLVLCNGSKFSISGHEGLYNLIGRRFGAGDDRNFVMPDLRAAAPPKYNYFLSPRGVFPPRG